MEPHYLYAYAAGLVDGEGSVGMHMHNTGPGRVSAVVTLTATNRNKEAMDLLQELFSGDVVRVRSTNPNSNYVYNYKLMGRERLMFAFKCIQPYCIIKREQIALALSFFDQCPSQHGVPLTEEQMLFRDSFITRFRELNKRGVQHADSDSGT